MDLTAEEEDSDPCKANESTFNGKLKKIVLQPRKNQMDDMSQFLHAKTKSILNHPTKEVERNNCVKWFIDVKVKFTKSKPNVEDLYAEPHCRGRSA